MDLEIKKRPWIGGERGNSETLRCWLEIREVHPYLLSTIYYGIFY